MVPVPKSRRVGPRGQQAELGFDDTVNEGRYSENAIVNEIRGYLEAWRSLPDPHDWGVTPATQRLLQHWRHHEFNHAMTLLVAERDGETD